MAYSETIEIVTKMRDEATGRLKNFQKVLKQVNQSTGTVTETTKRVSAETGRMNTVMKRTTRGLKFFQFEWLSVMFLGMAINKVFAQYVKGALEMLGITELFTEALKLTVFTALEPFLDSLYSAIGWFFDLSDGTQKIIGWFIILMTVFSGAMMWLAMLKLGFQGINMLGGIWGVIVKGIGSAFGWMGGVASGVMSALGIGVLGLIAVIALIVAVIVGIVVAWKEGFMNMKKIVKDLWTSIKMIFGGLLDMIIGVLKIIVGVFTLNWSMVVSGVKQILEGFKNYFLGLFLTLANFIAVIGIGIIRVFMGVVTKIVDFFKWLYSVLVGGSIIPDLVNAMIMWFWKLPVAILDALKSILKNVYDWGVNFITNMGSGISSMASKFKDYFLSIFPSWARNAIWGSGQALINIVSTITEIVKKVTKRQHGGFVAAGSPYIVGEAGPELFMPQTSGAIVPNNKLGASSSSIVFSPVYNINVADKRDFENMIKLNNTRMVDDLRRLVQD